MKGDFSKWRPGPECNVDGVLHQQGRVLLDSDWNEQARIINNWRDRAGRDIMGSNVAAVPAAARNGFEVLSATRTEPDCVELITLTLRPGTIWADGIMACLTDRLDWQLGAIEEADKDDDGNSEEVLDPCDSIDKFLDVKRRATYLEPPIQDMSLEAPIGLGVRDAVVLEVWRETINGFQAPRELIEPALGGVDTTERISTAVNFRLLRLKPGDSCENIREKLQDDCLTKGRLTVTLKEPLETPEPCPQAAGGGYTGFEHNLYRIEIARVNDSNDSSDSNDSNDVWFKWSQFNGTPTGRGDFKKENFEAELTITANDQAIKTCGLTEYYMEIVKYDQGRCRVIYGADVSLDGDILKVKVATERYSETTPPSGNVFFRLWNGIRPISDFSSVTELRDGINLKFSPGSSVNYRPGDYWTFSVRAGQIANKEILIANMPPDGIEYHRVPLAILHWGNNTDESTAVKIDDCRRVFYPLTQLQVCCSYRVGDGVHSHGDFDSIEEALTHLPDSGGEICLLPGIHEANVVLENRSNITIRGCQQYSKVIPRENGRYEPVFHIENSSGIVIENMEITTFSGTAVLLMEADEGKLRKIDIRENKILAFDNAVRVKGGSNINIYKNKIKMVDKTGAGVGIFILAEDSCVERNELTVHPYKEIPNIPDDTGDDITPIPEDPCADVEKLYKGRLVFLAYVHVMWNMMYLFKPARKYEALGGIQIAGGSERIAALDNRIMGGAGNGITLGTLPDLSEMEDDIGEEEEFTVDVRRNRFRGYVKTDEALESGTSFILHGPDPKYVGVEDDGSFSLEEYIYSRTYRISLDNPDWRIINIEYLDSIPGIPGNIINYHVITVERREQEDTGFESVLAFLYDINIEGNEINGMGLSGIGLPRIVREGVSSFAGLALNMRRAKYDFLSLILMLLGTPVIGLRIHRNGITDCLQNDFEAGIRAEAKIRGLGGISLGMCEGLSICENRIEDNGTSHVNPTCGIFVILGEQIEISHNFVANNGPVLADDNDDLLTGNRGGIVMGASAFSLLGFLLEPKEISSVGLPAVRIHGNRVDQPVGNALTIIALGPVSVQNNYLNSRLTGPDGLNRLAGSVLILNLGGMERPRTAEVTGAMSDFGLMATSSDMRPTETDTSTEPAENNRSVRAAIRIQPSDRARFRLNMQRIPDGNILFNGNQTKLGFEAESFISQIICTKDDLGFDGNQSDALGRGLILSSGHGLVVNTLLMAGTLRASDSRFKEGPGQEIALGISLFSISNCLNITTNNQGDNCIIAKNYGPSGLEGYSGNFELNQSICKILRAAIAELDLNGVINFGG